MPCIAACWSDETLRDAVWPNGHDLRVVVLVMPSTTSPGLLDAPLLALDGAAFSLGMLLHGPLVVVFVRHYGCIFCRERAAEVRAHRAAIERKGASIVFVGNGLPAMAREFAAQHADGLPVLSDPSKKTFELAGMRRGLSTVLRPSMLKNAWRAFRSGHRQTKVQGDPWQQGGAIVIAKDGAVVHAQRDCAAGDAIDWARVVAAIPGA